MSFSVRFWENVRQNYIILTFTFIYCWEFSSNLNVNRMSSRIGAVLHILCLTFSPFIFVLFCSVFASQIYPIPCFILFHDFFMLLSFFMSCDIIILYPMFLSRFLNFDIFGLVMDNGTWFENSSSISCPWTTRKKGKWFWKRNLHGSDLFSSLFVVYLSICEYC